LRGQAPIGQGGILTFFKFEAEPYASFFFNPRYFCAGALLEATMGPAKPFRSTALIVEDDPMQRAMVCLLLEESDYEVIQCESGEAAELVLQANAGCLSLMMTDVNLAGPMNGVELAVIAKQSNPELDVIVTSGKPLPQRLPDGAKFWSKPWPPLDIVREAEMVHAIEKKEKH
jgi:CheY-like chemotaxis protein